MKRMMLVLAVAGLFVTLASAAEPAWEDIGRGNSDITAVLVEAQNARRIYSGAKGGILKSEDGGDNWRSVLLVKGQNTRVNFLFAEPQNGGGVYAAGGAGLFYSADQGRNWKRIFQGKNAFEKECTSIVFLGSSIYLGTKNGLFISSDQGRSWQKQAAQLRNSHILAIAASPKEPNCVYVACVDGVFKSKDAAQSWERIFTDIPAENGSEDKENNEDRDEEEKFSRIRYIGIDPVNVNCLYLATSRGVYKSRDKGVSWQALSNYGLLSRDTQFILISPKSDIYVATKSGIFEYKQERWQELSLRLAGGEVRFLAQDNQDNLYAACEKGLFKAKIGDSDNLITTGALVLHHKNEPDIHKVQQAAIKYAEVEPEKIIRWRKQAAKKAFLPQMSVGVGRNVTDLWHWETGSTTKADDDVLRKGNDAIEWDVTLSWNLGEIIWNDDQTNIDVRSRLMVELRNDVLDEVNKIYFERLRVKMELDNLSIEDVKKHFEKELRVQELTAQLDALTGGYFSNQIK